MKQRRWVGVLVLAAVVAFGPPAAAETDDQVQSCVVVTERRLTNAQARKRCDAEPTAQVHRLHKAGRWTHFVTPA